MTWTLRDITTVLEEMAEPVVAPNGEVIGYIPIPAIADVVGKRETAFAQRIESLERQVGAALGRVDSLETLLNAGAATTAGPLPRRANGGQGAGPEAGDGADQDAGGDEADAEVDAGEEGAGGEAQVPPQPDDLESPIDTRRAINDGQSK